MSSCLPTDRLPSINVSTKKGGRDKYNNQSRSISARCVSAAGLHIWLHMVLMHDMDMQHSSTTEGKTMKRLAAMAIVGVFLLAVVSTAVAQPAAQRETQQSLQPVYRLGNFLEVAND